MSAQMFITFAAFACFAALAGCALGTAAGQQDQSARYLGVDTRLLDDSLVNFRVAMRGDATSAEVVAYTECAAAQYALIRGYGFARHLRTTTQVEGGIWRGDAVYTISAALPDGLRTIDAEVTVDDCREKQIPTV